MYLSCGTEPILGNHINEIHLSDHSLMYMHYSLPYLHRNTIVILLTLLKLSIPKMQKHEGSWKLLPSKAVSENKLPKVYVLLSTCSSTWFSPPLGHNAVIPSGWGSEGPVIPSDVVLLAQNHLIQEHDGNVATGTTHCSIRMRYIYLQWQIDWHTLKLMRPK